MAGKTTSSIRRLLIGMLWIPALGAVGWLTLALGPGGIDHFDSKAFAAFVAVALWGAIYNLGSAVTTVRSIGRRGDSSIVPLILLFGTFSVLGLAALALAIAATAAEIRG